MTRASDTADAIAATRGRGTALIVDSDDADRAQVHHILTGAGWRTLEAAHGHSALTTIADGGVDVMTLAIDLDAESGYDLCSAVRALSQIPIVFLTHRANDRDHAFALDQGGDAFLTKPCNAKVLIAEVAAAQRRAGYVNGHGVLEHGALLLDHVAHRCSVAGRDVSLSKTEFALLESLMSDAGRALSRQELLARVWGPWFGDSHVVEVTVARVRRKLASVGAEQVIRTIAGYGYGLVDPEAQVMADLPVSPSILLQPAP